MRQVMENMRWHLGNWLARYSGRDWSTFTGTEKITCYVWQSWERGAVLVLVLAFMPFLFPVALFLSFVGFICTVPLLCGAAIYYLSFRDFPLCFGIAEFICPSHRPSEGFIGSSQADEEDMLHSVPFGAREVGIRQDGFLPKPFSVGARDVEGVPRRALNDSNSPLLEGEDGNERVEAGIREYPSKFEGTVPSEGHHASGAGSSSSATSPSNVVYAVRRPNLLLLPANLQSPYEERKANATWSLYEVLDEIPAGTPRPEVSNVLSGEICKSDQREIRKGDMVVLRKGSDVVESQSPAYCSPDVYSVRMDCLVQGTVGTPQSGHMAGTDWRPDTNITHESYMLGVCGEHPSAESVFREHTVNTDPTGESSELQRHFCQYTPDGKICLAANRMSTGYTTAMGIATPRSKMYTPGKELEDRPLSVDSNVVQTLRFSPLSSAEVPDYKPFGIRSSNAVHATPPQLSSLVSEKRIESAYTNVTFLESMESAPKSDTSSVSLSSTCVTCMEKLVEGENERLRSSLRFASPLVTNQRRLSFSNVLSDDEVVSPRCFFPSGKLINLTPDCKQQSVSTSFSSDYPWSSGSSEQGSENLSTQRAAYEELYMDTASSSALYEDESNLELGVLPISTFCPTPDQLTEDWETRRKRWEEESTPGRLVPLSPCMEVHSAEARSICNPLFEFSTASPAPNMLKTPDTNRISSSPPLLIRFSERHSPLPQSPRTSAGLAERVETCSGKFEGLLAYWRRRERMGHTLTSSPGQSLSPAELAYKIREEIDAMQVTVGQEIPPQYSLWKEVEVLSQIVGMKLPYMGDMSDIVKAKDGLELLKVEVLNICDVE